MEPPPPTGVTLSSYPDSIDSSPRSRTTDSWDEPPFPSPRIRLMCSYGGRIVPRPTDKSLCYLGGETRIVAIDRHSSLSDLSSKLSRSLHPSSFTLKYQLPNEDLDSLISLTTDEDLDNMVDEYDRIASAAPTGTGTSTKQSSSRIRLFLFPNKIESAPSSTIGSLLDDSKSETWFVDALNGTMGIGMGSTDSQSVNHLLGLDDDSSSVHSRGGAAVGKADQDQYQYQYQGGLQQRQDSKVGRQDVQSVPDSPMLETNSSFGSTSSAPSLSNLPPIRVSADDTPPNQRYGNLDEHFQQQMNLASAAAAPQQTIQVPNVAAAAVSTPMISPTDNSNRVFESDEEKSDTPKVAEQKQAANLQKSPLISDSRSVVYYQESRVPAAPPVNPIPNPNRERIPAMDPATGYRMQQMQVNESGYIVPQMSAQPEEHHPIPHPQVQYTQQQQQQQQQQFMPVHQLPPSYYQLSPHHTIQQSQQFDPSTVPMYYVPYPQHLQPQSVPLPKVAPKPEFQPNLYRTASPQAAPMMHVPGHAYPGMVYHHPSQIVGNYGYEYVNVNSNTNTMTSVDTMQPQVYYTQSTSPPSMMPGQYQTVISDGQQAAEMKQNRAS